MKLEPVVLIFFLLIFSSFISILCSVTGTDNNRSTFYQTDCKVPKSTASSEKSSFNLFLCAVVPDRLISPTFFRKTYKEFFDKMILDIANSMNYSTMVKVITTNVTKFYQDPCKQVYDRFVKCFQDYCNRTNDYNSMLIYGPWCSLQIHEHEMVYLQKIFYSLPDDADVAIMTTNPQFMPITVIGGIADVTVHPGLKTITKPSTLMFLSGTIPRFVIGIWNMLNYFQYRHAVWITVGEEKFSLIRYCLSLANELQLRSSLSKPKMYINYYEWYTDGQMPSDFYSEIWLKVKSVTRIIILCGNDRETARFAGAMVKDMNAEDKYGLFAISRSFDTLDWYLDRLRTIDSIKALQFLKVLTPKRITCPEYGDQWSFVKHANMTLFERDRLATLSTLFSNTFCAVHHYYRKIAVVVGTDKRLASVFAETFRPSDSTLISRHGQAIQWLPILELYSANKENDSMKIVLELNWNNSVNGTTYHFVKKLGPILWYGSEEPLLDALYVCSDNVTRFFPCPKVIYSEISKTNLIIIIVSGILVMVLFTVGILFIVRYYIHNNQRYLVSRWWISIKEVQLHLLGKRTLSQIDACAREIHSKSVSTLY